MKLGFVILHYMDFEMTNICVESIFSLNEIDNTYFEIIIIDNASTNNSFIELKDRFKLQDKVHIIKNNKNLGFAQGNNVGYNYAKSNLGLDTIFVMNNDIVFEDNLFLSKFKKIDQKNVDIISPNIINRNNYNQSPIRDKGISSKKFITLFFNNLVNYILYSIPLINKKFEKMKEIRKSQRKLNTQYIADNDDSSMIVPHGAFVIFTKNWIDCENFAFYPKTFMYFEEDILHKYCKKNNKKIIYIPELIVRHLEDVSTDKVYTNKIEKKKFISKNMVKSMLIYLRA